MWEWLLGLMVVVVVIGPIVSVVMAVVISKKFDGIQHDNRKRSHELDAMRDRVGHLERLVHRQSVGAGDGVDRESSTEVEAPPAAERGAPERRPGPPPIMRTADRARPGPTIKPPGVTPVESKAAAKPGAAETPYSADATGGTGEAEGAGSGGGGKPRIRLEKLLGVHGAVALGAVALAFAGFFLIAYGVKQGWFDISPALRV